MFEKPETSMKETSNTDKNSFNENFDSIPCDELTTNSERKYLCVARTIADFNPSPYDTDSLSFRAGR